ncbi:MAG TPA: hypothetical protein VLE23_18065 [Geminicoccaceae bacterium]|nr:hypothetical protein [Geminicoccaceae bacterium]
MKRSRAGKRTPKAKAPPPDAKLKGVLANPKVGAQARRLLGKHYASKYQTMRRG